MVRFSDLVKRLLFGMSRGVSALSLHTRLLVLWTLSLAASVAVAVLLVQLYQESSTAQVQRAEAIVARACDMIRDRYAFDVSGGTAADASDSNVAFRKSLADAVSAALAREPGIEGGIWQAADGALAYAYPTYEGSGPKTD